MKDDVAFENTVRETESVVRAYIAGLGVAIDTVDDLAQEVYIEFYKTMNSMPPDVVPVRWLKGIARNVCMNYFRCSKRIEERRLEYLAEIMSKIQAESGLSSEPGPLNERLQVCLQKLNDRQRLCIRLRYEEELSVAKVAEHIGSSASTIRVTIYRLLQILRECITQTPEATS